MTTNHTPGPWALGRKVPRYFYAGDETCIGGCDSIGETPAETERANAERIVQCVNACEGMPDPAAEIAALQDALEVCIKALRTLARMKLGRFALNVVTAALRESDRIVTTTALGA